MQPSRSTSASLRIAGPAEKVHVCCLHASRQTGPWPQRDSDTRHRFIPCLLPKNRLAEDMDGSLCSFQQYLYDRWATCPPVARIPGDFVPVESQLAEAIRMFFGVALY